jgi:hypothetical protein
MLDNERLKQLMKKMEANKRSMDDIVGFIIRKAHEDERYNGRLDYEEVVITLSKLRQYFEQKEA